jgi:hypothetical protein
MSKTRGEQAVCYSELFAPLPERRALYDKERLVQHLCMTGSLSEVYKLQSVGVQESTEGLLTYLRTSDRVYREQGSLPW